MTGRFITFEGGEGAGKTTQIKLLAASLEDAGHKVLLTREPGGTPEAEKLRDLVLKDPSCDLDDREIALLVTAARANHVRQIIGPALRDGKIVLCDRFADSTLVYQGYAGGLGFEAIEALQRWALGDLWPDLTFYFDLDPESGLMRTNQREDGQQRFEGYDLSFHHRLREGFQELARRYPDRIQTIDASRPVATIQEDLAARILNLLDIQNRGGR